MPINRPDGRHWCDPASEEPDEDGQWTCPECGTIWLRSISGTFWETSEQRVARLEAEEAAIQSLVEDVEES